MTQRYPRKEDSGLIIFLKFFTIITFIVLFIFLMISLFTRCTIVNLGNMEAKVNVDSLKINNVSQPDSTRKGGDFNERVH